MRHFDIHLQFDTISAFYSYIIPSVDIKRRIEIKNTRFIMEYCACFRHTVFLSAIFIKYCPFIKRIFYKFELPDSRINLYVKLVTIK